MHRCLRSVAVFLLFCAPAMVRADSAKTLEPTVTIETSLTTDAGHIRQFAFDGNADTYFASLHNVRRADHFTLVFDKPVVIRSVTVTTGRPARIVIEMVKWLDQKNVELADIRIRRPSLEDAFIELTGKSLRE